MSKSLPYSFVRDEDGVAIITVYHEGQTYGPIDNTHPQFEAIKKGADAGDHSVIKLFEIGLAIAEYVSLSDRVTYANRHLYVDGDEMADGLANHIVRMIENGDPVEPFVVLLENILQNPSVNSRRQLYSYIDRHNVTITPDGQLVLYKYLYTGNTIHPGTGEVSQYRSGHAGMAIVNGKLHKRGPVPQNLGDVITMPRSRVVDDPNTACSHGLHVGEWSYVANAGSARLEILVHPRDVVSVPRASSERKIRVCRYKLVGEVSGPYSEPVKGNPQDAGLVVSDEPSEPQSLPPSPPPFRFKPARVKHPSSTAFSTMKVRAKTRKQNFVRYATKMGPWILLDGCDGSRRTHWSV